MKSTLSSFRNRISSFARTRPYSTAACGIAIALLSWWAYGTLTSTAKETRYITARATRETLIVSLSGSGQVSAVSQLAIKPKTSGDVVHIPVVRGQFVRMGAPLMYLDSTDAQKSVRDAEISLESAKLSLLKLTQPANALTLTQTQNALTQAHTDRTKALADGRTTASNTFAVLPGIMSGLQDILYGTTVTHTQDNVSAYNDMLITYSDGTLNYKTDIETAYINARTAYDAALSDYKALSAASSDADIEHAVASTYTASLAVSEALKKSSDLLSVLKDKLTLRQIPQPALLSTHLSQLSTYTSQNNSNLSSLLSIKTTLVTSSQNIIEKQLSLKQLTDGADPLDVQGSKLSLQQRQNALIDAQVTLANSTVRAPFDGTVASIAVREGEPASSGTAVVTLITNKKQATISLNEVDVAKVAIGQKATLTFDAIDGLSLTGEVSDIDTIGTVSQGVVTYNVTITFDTQDKRIKPGMSVSTNIIIAAKPNALTIPNSAIKFTGDTAYVEQFSPEITDPVQGQASAGVPSTQTPVQKTVTVGASNDTSTEILSDLSEGEQVITRTVTAQTTSNQSSSAFNLLGGNRAAGGGAIRAVSGGR